MAIKETRSHLDFDFQRLLDGLNLDNPLLFFVQDLDGVFELGLETIQTFCK